MSEAASGAASGAVSGAAVGTAINPGIGTAVGAIVGGVWGAFSGSLGDKSKKKAKQASQAQQLAAIIQQQREAEAYRQNLLAEIRTARIQRASSLAAAVAAGVEEGSGSQGALGAIGSSTANIIEYMSVDRGRAEQAAFYQTYAGHLSNQAKKLSKKSQQSAQMMNTTFALASMGAAAYSMAGSAAASQAASQAGSSASGVASASGAGSGLATQTVQQVSGNTAGLYASTPAIGPAGIGSGAWSSADWTAAANQLQTRAMWQQTAASIASNGYKGYRYTG